MRMVRELESECGRTRIASRSSGFTLIELQVVVVIIGLLAAMAIPAFQKVRTTSQKLEGKSLAKGIRDDIQEFYEYTGRLPKNNQECGLPRPELIQGKYVGSVAVLDGAIQVVFKDKYRDKLEDVEFTPVIHPENPTGPIRWE